MSRNFPEEPDGSQRFVPLREPPSDVEVARLLATVRGRILRLLRRRDIDRVRARGRVVGTAVRPILTR